MQMTKMKKCMINRVAIMRVCSRDAAPLGDPRGVPKLSRFSSTARFLLLRQKLQYFKIRKVIIASQVIILAKIAIKVNSGTMSNMTNIDDYLNDIMDIISSDADQIPADQFDDLYELLNSDTDMSPVDNVDSFSLASPAPSSDTTPSPAPSSDTISLLPEPAHSCEIAGQFESVFFCTDNDEPVIQLHISPAQHITSDKHNMRTDHFVGNSGPVSYGNFQSFAELKKDMREKNNRSSEKYRRNKKLKSKLLEQELISLEQENSRLRAKEAAMTRMLSTMRQVYHNMVARGITASDQCTVLAEFIDNMSKSL